MINEALTQLLSTRSGLTATDGVYSVAPSTNTDPVNRNMPRILFTLLDGDDGMTDDGPDGIVTAMYQVDIFAATAAAQQAIVARLMQSANAESTPGMNGYTGTIDNTQIMLTQISNRRFTMAVHIEGQNQTVARGVLDVNLTYRELPV